LYLFLMSPARPSSAIISYSLIWSPLSYLVMNTNHWSSSLCGFPPTSFLFPLIRFKCYDWCTNVSKYCTVTYMCNYVHMDTYTHVYIFVEYKFKLYFITYSCKYKPRFNTREAWRTAISWNVVIIEITDRKQINEKPNAISIRREFSSNLIWT
jgi:hypothetical protein